MGVGLGRSLITFMGLVVPTGRKGKGLDSGDLLFRFLADRNFSSVSAMRII